VKGNLLHCILWSPCSDDAMMMAREVAEYRINFKLRYNLCQNSWNTCITSVANLIISPSPPQNNVDIYSVERYRKAAMLGD